MRVQWGAHELEVARTRDLVYGRAVTAREVVDGEPRRVVAVWSEGSVRIATRLDAEAADKLRTLLRPVMERV